MPKQAITTKDLGLLTELMYFEELAYKKCEMYAKTLTNPTLVSNCQQLAENHKARFDSLLISLNAHE